MRELNRSPQRLPDARPRRLCCPAVGAAAGNTIAIHNVVAAAATVGLMGREGTSLRMTILPTLYDLFMAGVLPMIAIYGMGSTDPMMLIAKP